MQTVSLGDHVFSPLRKGWNTGITGYVVGIDAEKGTALVQPMGSNNTYRCGLAYLDIHPEPPRK